VVVAARKPATTTVAVTLGLVAVQMVAAKLYFGSPLPLPFYAKSMTLYGEGIARRYQSTARVEFFAYVRAYWYLFAVLALDVSLRGADWWRSMPSAEKGLSVATAAFLAYYLFFVTQIMPFGQRFYHPTLPGLLFLAARSTAALAAEIRAVGGSLWNRAVGPWAVASRLVVLSLLTLLISESLGGTTNPLYGLRTQFSWIGQLLRGDALARFNPAFHCDMHRTRWFRLEQFSTLGDDAVFATTEVGLVGAMNPGKTVIDLAGLNETRIAHGESPASVIFGGQVPDLIYMPHPDYTHLLAQIEANPFFRENFAHYPDSVLGCKLGLALNKRSRYYPAMQGIVVDAMSP
jgi:hypothetical protein